MSKNHLFRIALVLATGGLLSCGKVSSDHPQEAKETPAPDAIYLLFTYGSEKEDWIKDVTADFNHRQVKTASGHPIYVEAVAQGSGECIDNIFAGAQEPDLTSPASEAFVKLGNAQNRVKFGNDLIGETQNLVLSPVVIGMWEPMAKALGWPNKPIGWSDILKLAQNPKGWASYDYPQWGQFKFGHTHPDYSNSGLISLFATVYAAAGKTANLQVSDVTAPKVAPFLRGIENSVLHYGSSTGFFAKKMFANGPQYLSAAVMYESLVVESRSEPNLAFPVVAIYPKEGTFWSDHPVGIVNREWVTPERKEAAKAYIQFLLDRPQQEKALKYGFRPGNPDIPTGAPIDAAHGVDPKQPQTVLQVPSTDVMQAIRDLWQQNRRHARVTVVFDCSGSMNDYNKIDLARQGATDLVDNMADADLFSVMPFNNEVLLDQAPQPLKTFRPQALQIVSSLIASGGTSLYDTLALAYQHVEEQQKADPTRIPAIVILSDGQDTTSHLSLDQLLKQITYNFEDKNIRIFSIGYIAEDGTDILKKISDVTQGRYYEGNKENIRQIFRDISTFF
ncbi:MAG: VWA domain-containing protein [Verrucomicrobia bacterium]|nr:VWA domain-containing protein [Verrucomicrobiota bacterium]